HPLLIKQLAGLISAGDGPGTLTAVFHPPPDLVADSASASANALADARCRHAPSRLSGAPSGRVGRQLGVGEEEVKGAAGGSAVGGADPAGGAGCQGLVVAPVVAVGAGDVRHIRHM